MWLSNSLVNAVEEAKIRVFYVSFQATRLWASERDKDEPLVFSGYYWALGPREAGPFRSMSAAYRDAYYRVVRRTAPPVVAARNTMFERKNDIAANKARAARDRRRAASARPVSQDTKHHREARVVH